MCREFQDDHLGGLIPSQTIFALSDTKGLGFKGRYVSIGLMGYITLSFLSVGSLMGLGPFL